MRVAIFSPYATVIPHFETELDIAQQHLDAGDSVEFLNCDGGLSNCDFNVDRTESRCNDCIGRRKMGIELLSPTVQCRSFLSSSAPGNVQLNFESVEQLIEYRVDDFDIGYAALSSVVSICRDPEPDLAQHRSMLNRFLQSAWQVYHQTLDYIRENEVDRIYVYNGRFAGMRAVFRACEKKGVDCFLHERGCNGQHYELFKNHLPHHLPSIHAAIESSWKAAESNPQRQTIASQWHLDRFNRVEKAWHSFVKSQESGRLPENFDATRKNISIFCSSDDEFVAIGEEWRNDLYPNQVTAIARIAADLLMVQPETHLYLRVHPNLTDVDNMRKREMLALVYPNLTVIPPDAPIDSYELLKASDIVVSFGSSVGSEAMFWGKPSVLLGPCFYQSIGGLYRSRSHSETIELLASDLKPQDNLGALKYGFWFQTRGRPHQYFTSTGLFEGQFKNQTIYARPEANRNRLARFKKNARRVLAALIPGK